MCFFDKFQALCNSKGKAANAVARELGLSSGTVTVWKKNRSVPRLATLKKVADYFHISIETLMQGVEDYGAEETEKPLVNNDEELTEMLERIRDDPKLRMLFSVTKNAKPEDIDNAVKIILALKGE